MLQNFKPKPRHIKLDKQDGMPSIKLLEEMKQKAHATAGATVELSFGADAQTLILTVSRDASKGSWLWMLYVDDGFGSKMDWSYVSHDVTYIEALIGNSHPELQLKIRVTQETTIAQEPPQKVRKGTLEGNLGDIQISNLLQSVNMGQMTGRLEIVSGNDKANIFFSNGDPVHATIRGAESTEAFLQLFIWEEGSFSFFNEPVTVPPTITRGLIGLIMEGATFVDHYTLLKQRGLTHECYPVHVTEVASADELSSMLKGGVDCNKEFQWDIYQRITGSLNWAEIVRDLSAKKTEWVPAMFNLVTCGLVRFDSASPNSKAKPTTVDWSIVQTVKNSMCRSDTGMYTYASLLYSLEQEFSRYEGFELPFSIVVFGYCIKTDEPQSGPVQFIPLKPKAMIELRNRAIAIKKKYDLLCHYGAFAYAILLPLTLRENAARFADILAETCAGIEVTESPFSYPLEFCAGVANIPEDCQSLDELLQIAGRVHGLTD